MNERSPFLTGTTERDPNHVPFVTELEIDDMNDYPQNPNDVDAFTETIRAQFPGLIDIAFEGEVNQTNDETLVQFNGAGFRVYLDNGASFNILVQQVDYADEPDNDEDEYSEDDYTIASDTGVVIAQVRHVGDERANDPGEWYDYERHGL